MYIVSLFTSLCRLANHYTYGADALHGLLWREAEDISASCCQYNIAAIGERMLLGAQVADVGYVEREWLLDNQRVGCDAQDVHSHRVCDVAIAVT